jgi:hypothetical protein
LEGKTKVLEVEELPYLPLNFLFQTPTPSLPEHRPILPSEIIHKQETWIERNTTINRNRKNLGIRSQLEKHNSRKNLTVLRNKPSLLQWPTRLHIMNKPQRKQSKY